MENLNNIAVLIDADNTQISKAELILGEISAHGRIALKRAYGNWRKTSLRSWEAEMIRLAIKAQHQIDYTPRKNATDMALVIDAMDLLASGLYDGFALVSSDSDFTPLAIKLKESGAYVIGAGRDQTPESFKRACDEFIVIEYLVEHAADGEEQSVDDGNAATVEGKVQRQNPKGTKAVHAAIRRACDTYGDERGFAELSAVAQYVKRIRPDFSPKNYGCSTFSKFLALYPGRYEVKRKKHETPMYMRCR